VRPATPAQAEDFDLERISLALVDAVDEEFSRNEILRVAYSHDKEHRRKILAGVNRQTLDKWVALVIKPMFANPPTQGEAMTPDLRELLPAQIKDLKWLAESRFELTRKEGGLISTVKLAPLAKAILALGWEEK
jgi:hypothetical protein